MILPYLRYHLWSRIRPADRMREELGDNLTRMKEKEQREPEMVSR
ncbi:hypothetical protein [Parabacteroides hominis]|jgi:hypothetical protein|nr:hypothetical protein [Parabacteroides hominis]